MSAARALGLALMLLLLCPSPGIAAKPLTRAESRALDIVSLDVVRDDQIGLLATVTYRGNLERAIGRGGLKDAVAALILVPRAGSGAEAGLFTRGALLARRPMRTYPAVRMWRSEAEVRRRTRSPDVGVVRDGRRFTFVILGPGSEAVEAVEAKTFVSLAGRPRAVAAQSGTATPPPPKASDRDWARATGDLYRDYDRTRTADTAKLDCAGLRNLRKRLVLQIDIVHQTILHIQRELDDDAEDIRSGVRRRLRLAIFGFDAEVTQRREGIVKNRASFEDLKKGLEDKLAEVDRQIKQRCAEAAVSAVFRWHDAGPDEVIGAGAILRNARRAEGDATTVEAVRVVVPPAGSTQRRIVDTLCPPRLPVAAISTTRSADDTLTCSGGSLPTGEGFSLNVRTAPGASQTMGGELYAQVGGSFAGPFAITGP